MSDTSYSYIKNNKILCIVVLVSLIWTTVFFSNLLDSRERLCLKTPSQPELKIEEERKPNPCEGVHMDFNQICKGGTPFNLVGPNELLYDELLFSLREPRSTQKRFSKSSPETQLEIAFVELRPELSPRFLYNLYNIAHLHGGSETALAIVCHSALKKTIEILLQGWENVRIIPMVQLGQRFSISDYNRMLTSLKFWNNFSSKFVLITHIDSILFRRLDDWMYEYDLIGAPWPHNATGTSRPQVGNGGYTLRSVKVMKSVLLKFNYDTQFPNGDFPEDVWWSNHVDKLPSEKKAMFFSVEMYAHPIIPTGGHKPYAFDAAFNMLGSAFRLFQQYCDPI